MSTGLTISIMKSAKSLTSALHSFSHLSSLLFLTLFGPQLISPSCASYNPPSTHCTKTNLSLLHLLHQLTSLVHILRVAQSCFHIFFFNSRSPSHRRSFFLFLLSLHSPPSSLLHFSHCCFGLISLLGEAY